jgi:hypothetical protein
MMKNFTKILTLVLLIQGYRGITYAERITDVPSIPHTQQSVHTVSQALDNALIFFARTGHRSGVQTMLTNPRITPTGVRTALQHAIRNNHHEVAYDLRTDYRANSPAPAA